MRAEPVFIGFAALLLSAWLTGLVRRMAVSQGVLDVPNERSSHMTPTPRGGGLSMVLAFTAALVVLAWLGTYRANVLAALFGGGTAVAAIGFLDDRSPIPAAVRLSVHIAAAIWAVFWLSGSPLPGVGTLVAGLTWPGCILSVLGIVWTLNLFNFMDGIDGIAISEAVFVSGGAWVLSWLHAGSADVPSLALIFCAACGGFLVWNWPPAKIFMGDVGSGYLGFVIAVLALAAASDDPTATWRWLILGGVFVVDASVTLARRAVRGERVHEAHRTHAYQWLARRWGHRRVTVAVLVVNVLWLLPCAAVATLHRAQAGWMLVVAYVPLLVSAIAAGSGRAEHPRR